MNENLQKKSLKIWSYSFNTAISVISLVIILIFSTAPIITALRSIKHLVFDFMVMNHEDIMDGLMFPLVGWTAAALYVISIGKYLHAKGSITIWLKKNPLVYVLLMLIIWMLISAYYINRPTSAIFYSFGLKHESFMLQLEYFLCFLFLGYQIHLPKCKEVIFHYMLYVSIILVPVAFFLWKNMIVSPLYDWNPCFEAIFTNPNYYGYFLTVFTALSAALFAGTDSKTWRVFYAAALMINTVGLSFSQTRGAWIGSMFACIFLIIIYRIRDGHFNQNSIISFFIFLITFVLTGMFNGVLGIRLGAFFNDLRLLLFDSNSLDTLNVGTGRWKIWLRSADLIKKSPLFGIGFDGIQGRDLVDYVGNPRPHNEYLQYMLFYGIPAGILYIIGCLGIFLRGLKNKTKLDNMTLASLVAAFGYLVGACFGLTVFSTAPYLFIMLGMGYYRPSEE